MQLTQKKNKVVNDYKHSSNDFTNIHTVFPCVGSESSHLTSSTQQTVCTSSKALCMQSKLRTVDGYYYEHEASQYV